MARKFLTSIDLAKNQLLNALIHVLGAAPGSPAEGQIYYDSTAKRLLFFNGTVWVDYAARANHTGTQLAASISDFNTQVVTSRLDQMAAPTGSLSLNSQRMINMADGIAANDSATVGQMLNAVNGTDWKMSCRCASTANIATLSGLLTVDGITVVSGDRVLVKDQTTGSQNGIYVAAAGAWARATDADGAGEVTAGMALMVTEGTVQADTQWRLTTDDPITIGTTALVFAQIGAGSSYTNGTGITIAGNVISIDTAVVARKFAATIGDGSATSITVTHNLGTQDVTYSIRQLSDNAYVECDALSASTTQLTLSFAVAPASNALRVTVTG